MKQIKDKERRKVSKERVTEVFVQIVTLVVSIFAFAYLIADVSKVVAAQEQVTYCCEKTKSGAWCQNELQENCDPAYSSAPTSCDAFSPCKPGCCYDSSEGTCAENTVRRVCDESNGTWTESPSCDPAQVPQCAKGCCILGNEASLTTLVRCKKLASYYGLGVDFRSNIQSEPECIATAQAADTGACVFEKEFEKTCKFTTRQECKAMTGNESAFHKDYLCTAEELGTNCAMQDKTTCVEGKDEVYFVDTCGNIANIYDASKVKDKEYWRKVVKKEDSCGATSNNARSTTCGNCNYYLGSMCGSARRGIEPTPQYGDNICRDLNCYNTYNGKDYKHGESWCVYDASIGNGTDVVGSRHWKHYCYMGEEKVEPCSDYREQICVQDVITSNETSEVFNVAACRANDWRSCIDYNTIEDKEDAKKKCEENSDCYWFSVWNPGAGSQPVEVCLPQYPPGYKFGPNASIGGQVSNILCSMADQKVTVTYVKECKFFGLFGSKWKCVGNCEAETEEWTQRMNKWCTSLGDCGAYVNIAGNVTTDGYDISGASPKGPHELSQAYLDSLRKFTIPVPGLYATGAGSAKGFAETIGPTLLGVTGATGVGFMIAAIIKKGGLHGLFYAGIAPGAPAFLGPVLNIAGAAVAGYLIGQMFGLSSDMSFQLAIVGLVTAALFQFEVIEGLSGWLGGFGPSVIGIAVVILLALMAKLMQCDKRKTYTIEFKCMAWQPPTGGADCEKCNTEPIGGEMKPCTEYRCSSLGASCSLINVGTGKEMCVWLNRDDVTPPTLKPWEDVLTKNHEYVPVKVECPPTSPGCFKIVSKETASGCIKAFTPLTFGIVNNEPAQCKLDYNHTAKFDDMKYWFGNDLYLYNHSLTMKLPGPENVNQQAYNLTGEAPEIKNDGIYNMFIRCRDGNGNWNTGELAFNFCVDPGPDNTPPYIVRTSITSGAGIGYNVNSTPLYIFVNEPSTCKWSRTDQDYERMENSFTCITDIEAAEADGTYRCSTTLTDVASKGVENVYYFRCKDQPYGNESDRNVMTESYVFKLVGSWPLNISSIEPENNSTIYGGYTPVSVYLKAETINGFENGKATCYYSNTGYESMIEFFKTRDTSHEQQLLLGEGNHTYYVKCVDGAGNTAQNSTSFSIIIDRTEPAIARVYQEGGMLKIITDEESECRYSMKSCDYVFDQGIEMPPSNDTEHSAEWRIDITYYVKCKDKYGNQPAPASCSAVIHGYEVPSA